MHKILLCVVLAAVVAAQRAPRAADLPDDRASVEHALNRLAFGPRPGDIDRVQQIGLAAWIDRQLHPASIDDAALAPRLGPLPELPAEASQQAVRQYRRQSVQALASEKVLRAIYSERQLDEVLVDFWFNHFNVFAGKGRTSLYLVAYEREAIRPHVWGRFRDLLGATAKSPAMLFYLDNWLSSDPAAAERAAADRAALAARRRARPGGAGAAPAAPAQAQALRRRAGLNENYARELLELHTLGVDGGYTQEDIVNVARAFTGWTLGGDAVERMARAGQALLPGQVQRAQMATAAGEFRFMPALHDPGDKVVLGETLKGGGLDEGERILDILASHPATARHIATKLARRFVSDEPSEALVARVAARFLETDGDLRETVRAVVTSPELFAAETRRAKTKTPLEFVVSAVRATGRDVPNARPIVTALQQLGMMPYMSEPPTGYDEAPEAWISAGALITRMNIAQRIAGDQASTIGGPEFQRR